MTLTGSCLESYYSCNESLNNEKQTNSLIHNSAIYITCLEMAFVTSIHKEKRARDFSETFPTRKLNHNHSKISPNQNNDSYASS